MQQPREHFVEPEIVKHQEKMADVTARIGYGGTDSGPDDISPFPG
jgi:hypothetical protein